MRKYILIALLIPAGLSAQTPLSLNEAVAKGLKNNYSIQIAANNRDIADNNNSAGAAGMLPSVLLTGSNNYNINNTTQIPFSGPSRELSGAKTTSVNAGAQLSWTIFDGLRMFAEKDRLKQLEDLGEIQLKASINNTVANIISSYTELVQQQEKLKAFKESIALSKIRTFIAEQKTLIGSGSEYEQMKAQSDLNTDSTNYIHQLGVVKTTQVKLIQAMSETGAFDVIADSVITLQPKLNMNALQEKLLNANNDLEAASKNLEIAESRLKTIKAARYPVVSLNAGYIYNRQVSEAGFFQTNQQYGPSIGLTATAPLFDGYRVNRNIRNASLDTKTAELQRKDMELKVRSDFYRLYSDYENSLNAVQIGQRNVVIARKNSEISMEKYRIGSISSTELREVQKNLVDVIVTYVNDLYLTKALETELLRVTGNLVK